MSSGRVILMFMFVVIFLVGLFPTDSYWLISFGLIGFFLTLFAPRIKP